MDKIELLGIVAGILTTSGFVPQVIKTYKTKSAKDLSLGMYSLFIVGILLWLVYGFYVKSVSVIATNMATLIFSSILVYFKLTYKD